MKKIILGLCAVFLLAVFACSVSADVAVTSNFGDTTPTFGGEDQDASNPELDNDDNDYDVYADGTVTLSNNGTANVTVDSISISYNMGFDNGDLNITLKNAVIVPANGTANAELSARITEKLDAVNNKQKAIGFNVADITFKSGSTDVATFNAYMQRENNLEIDKIKVTVADDTTTIDEDGETVEDAKPGDTVTILVIAENKFSDNDDIDIDADKGQWEIRGDIDEEDDLDYGDISADKKDELDFTFTIDEDVGNGKEDFVIYVYGEDDFGAKHGHRIEAEFEIKKEKHEIKIKDISVVPLSASCGDSVAVKVDVVNIGKNDEDKVAVRIQNSELEIDSIKSKTSSGSDIGLDEGDSKELRFDFVIPADAAAGSKSFTVISYYDFNEESDRETFSIDITTCTVSDDDASDDSSDDDASDDNTSDDTPQADTGGGTATAQTTSGSAGPGPITTISSSRDSGFRSSTLYILLLILAIVIVVMAGAFMTAKIILTRK